MFSVVSILYKVALFGLWCLFAVGVGFAGTRLYGTYQEYRHLLQQEQEQSHRLEQLRRVHQQHQDHLQHLLTDEEFFEQVVKQRMGYLHDEEILFRFEHESS
jgi:cell division protein FtsB